MEVKEDPKIETESSEEKFSFGATEREEKIGTDF